MNHRSKKPAHYRTPLRSRQAIADYLASVGGYDSAYGRQGRSYFAFNVKCYGVDLDFEHLVEVYRSGGYYDDGETWLDNPEWLDQAREKYEAVRDKLFNWGVEDAGRLVTDSDCYNHLYDGTKLGVEYAWMGRSGGYLGIGNLRASTSRRTRAGTTGTRSSGVTRIEAAPTPGSIGTGVSPQWTSRP